MHPSLNALNALQADLDYLPITTPIMREAASLWAEARQRGTPTADRHALDGDVILVAIARLLIADGHDIVVATTIDEAIDAVGRESWPEFIDRTYGSLADSDLTRHPQGAYEQREEMA